MNLDHLRTLRLVLEHGTFSRAAEALHVSQSTVSFQIKALEAACGTRLVDRRGRSVRPTPAGRVLARYAKRLLVLADEAAARVRSEEPGVAGPVTIAASTVPAEYFLPPVLARFRAAHPDVSARVEVSDSRKAARALLAEECDLAVVGARLRDARIEWSRFGEDEIVLVGPPGRAFPHELGRADLEALPLVLREAGSGTREAIAKLLPSRLDAPGAGARLEIGSTEAARRCALQGIGLTFISRTAVADDLAAGRLRVIKARGTPVRRHFFVGRLRGITLSASARSLFALLTSTC